MTEIDLSKVPTQRLIDELESRKDVNNNNRYSLDDETKALAVAESYGYPLKDTAEKWGVTHVTIIHWRNRVRTDPKFAKLVVKKQLEFRRDLSDASSAALRESLDYIRRFAQSADLNDPKNLRAVAGAVKMVGELQLATEITYSRLGKNSGAPALTDGSAEEQNTYSISPSETVVEGDFQDVEIIED